MNPQYDVGYAVRGSVRRLTGEYTLAIADYSKAIEINPKSISRFDSRASLYLATGEHDLALSDYKKVLEIPAVTARFGRSRRSRVRLLSGPMGLVSRRLPLLGFQQNSRQGDADAKAY